MTPTLMGRWQSRIFLLGTFGLLVTALFFRSANAYLTLLWVIIFGLGWDLVYMQIQRRRWDHDWPPLLQFAAGVWEGVFLFLLLTLLAGLGFNSPLGLRFAPPPGAFVAHYTTVWVVAFLASQSIMRLLFPRWRFYGGEIVVR